MSITRLVRPLLAALFGCLLLTTTSAAPARAAYSTCNLWASPTGSDSASGTAAKPLATVQRLIDRLKAGQTGCLRSGTYTKRVTGGYIARFGHGGAAGKALILRSGPKQRATLRGPVAVPNGSDDVTLANLNLDGRPSTGATRTTSLQINAANTVVIGNDITNHGSAICSVLGFTGYGSARGTRIIANTFHDCGDPSRRMQDHAVYVDDGTNVQVSHNVFLRTAGYAVHLYPDAQRTLVADNVMFGNGGGVIFAGDGPDASANNWVVHNVIADTTKRPAIEAYWGGGKRGSGNVASANCLSTDNSGGVDTSGGGFRASGNRTTPVQFVNPWANNWSLAPGSPCKAVIGAR